MDFDLSARTIDIIKVAALVIFIVVAVTLDQTTTLYETSWVPHIASFVLFIAVGYWLFGT